MSFPNSIAHISGSVTRPADTIAYASGDLVANSTTAASVVPIALSPGLKIGGSAQLRRIRLLKSGTSATNAAFRIHLFNSGTITAANGDNGAFSVSASANYLGQFDVASMQAFTDGCMGWVTGELNILSQNLYALIECRGAYTPVSGEVFTVTVEFWTL